MSLLPKKPSIDQEFVKTASHVGYATVGRKLVGSVREYRAATIATPLLVLGEVVCEVRDPALHGASCVDSHPGRTHDLGDVIVYDGRPARRGWRWCRSCFGAAAGLACAAGLDGLCQEPAARTCSTACRPSRSPTIDQLLERRRSSRA